MSKIINSSILKIISKETIKQYEALRQSRVTNMFDYYNVIYHAKRINFKELTNLSLDNYQILLLNFSKLMKHYNIKQPTN